MPIAYFTMDKDALLHLIINMHMWLNHLFHFF